MSEHLKYIIQELNKPPFRKSYNLISFDSLDGLLLLQTLNDVISEVDPAQKIDLREESADQTAFRLFEVLRIFRYKPPTDPEELSAFRQGLVQGDKSVIYPLLVWIFQRMPELKKRAYLARFLVKVNVPQEFVMDEEVNQLYRQYEEYMDTFKDTHKTLETLRRSGVNTADVKKDISAMQDEKDQLMRRVERLKKRVDSFPRSGPMLEVAKRLRVEQEREGKLQRQVQEQRHLIDTVQNRIHRVQQMVKDQRASGVGQTPEMLLQRLEEEAKVNQYLVSDKLPKQLTYLRDTVSKLNEVVTDPILSQSQLDNLLVKIRDMNTEINRLTEKKLMSVDTSGGGDKLSLFRQQASIIQRKKEAAAEAREAARLELQRAEAELEKKREELQSVMTQQRQGDSGVATGEGQAVVKADEFKSFVNKLRGKSNQYKDKRQVLSELKAEVGVLVRTQELLQKQEQLERDRVLAMEAKKGVAGYHDTQESLEKVSEMMSTLNERKVEKLEDMGKLIQKLNSTIASMREKLAPLVKEMRQLRPRVEEMQKIYDEKKQAHDLVVAGMESNRSKLEQEVRAYREECRVEESRYHYLNTMISILKQQQVRVQNEMRSYIGQESSDKKKSSLRDIYHRKINEQDSLGRTLREKQRGLRESHGSNMRQVQLWQDLEKLLQCQEHCRRMAQELEEAGGDYAGVTRMDRDRMVL